MALITCHECGKQISSEAEKCPQCGAKKKRSLGRKLFLIGLTFMSVFVVILWASTSGGTSGSRPTAKKGNPVKASISVTRSAISLTNTGTPNWKEAELYLNDSPPFTYKVKVEAPAVGKTALIPLNEFAKKDGTRFNPQSTKVTEIWVGGSGYDFSKYGF